MLLRLTRADCSQLLVSQWGRTEKQLWLDVNVLFPFLAMYPLGMLLQLVFLLESFAAFIAQKFPFVRVLDQVSL